MNGIAVISFLAVIIAIIAVSLLTSKKSKIKNVAGLFFANRKLSFAAVGCALFFTNVNAAEFLGGSEAAYINNMTTMAWGVSSVFAMVIVSEFIMPVYLRGGINTTPDFLKTRFDNGTKMLVSAIFLIGYMVNLLPIILYTGAVALNGMFRISDVFHCSDFGGIVIMVIFMGIAGGTYSVLGGLKIIAVSDILLGVCLFAGGVFLTYFGLRYIGHGDWSSGWHQLLTTHKEHLNSIGSATDAVPFSGIFTGMLLVNLFYWGTEQVIVQQALSAKNLEMSQKGIALTCCGKLAGPFLFMLPGIIAVHAFEHMPQTIQVFPKLVRDLTPPAICGFIAAIVFGAAITSFSKALNSSGTLFILNIYKPYLIKRRKNFNDSVLLLASRKFEIIAALIAILLAPMIIFANSNFYTYIQKANATFSIPIFTVMFVGFLTKKVPPIAAKCGIVFCATGYLLTQFVFHTGINFLHILALLFIATTVLMLVIGKFAPMKPVKRPVKVMNSYLTPWRGRHWVNALLIAVMIAMFVLFSKAGLAG